MKNGEAGGDSVNVLEASIPKTGKGEVDGSLSGFEAVAWIQRSVLELGRSQGSRTAGMCNQLKGGAQMAEGKSDPLILLRDGRTDHMGKERTEQSTEQSTHALWGRNVPNRSVSSTLLKLREKAEREPFEPLSAARLLRGALCGKTARRDLRGGCPATGSPTLMAWTVDRML